MFIDSAEIKVKAGDGGNGRVSFRKEKFVDRGGPDGGDGGKGGDVVVVGDPNVDGLAAYRYQRSIAAGGGEAGDKRRRHGANGPDVLIKVPLGTELWEGEQLLADVTAAEQPLVIARGGPGGYGNAHFVSSRRQAPTVAEVGEKGEARTVRLELKLIADVGLIGLPNAGKSTFLSIVTSARPKIADYPFTTLAPNLGVADVDGHSLLIADIPGLIEGASAGKGLGDQFLRHVERTAVLLHLIDATEPDVVSAYKTIQAELRAYKIDLSGRPQIVVLTKTDAVDATQLIETQAKLKKATKLPIYTMSSVSRQGTAEILRVALQAVRKARRPSAKVAAVPATVPTLTLPDSSQSWSVKVTKTGYVIRGSKIEKFAARTDFANPAGVRRLRDIMRRMGIIHELERRGIQPGDQIRIGPNSIQY